MGPFFYAQGAGYMLSAPLVGWMAASGWVRGWLLPSLLNGSIAAPFSEDITVGFMTHRCPNASGINWGRSVFHDVDKGQGHRYYYQIEQQCLSRHNLSAEQLVTGTPSRWRARRRCARPIEPSR